MNDMGLLAKDSETSFAAPKAYEPVNDHQALWFFVSLLAFILVTGLASRLAADRRQWAARTVMTIALVFIAFFVTDILQRFSRYRSQESFFEFFGLIAAAYAVTISIEWAIRIMRR
jgi:phosphoglycerol transferase MdoB-like AlkP superfamily enzyme